MTTKTINDKTVQYICSVCGHDYGRMAPWIKPFHGNNVTGEIKFCIECGHEFYSNPWMESVRVGSETKNV